MNDIVNRILIGVCIFVGVPALISVIMLTVMAYLYALNWVWVYLQVWWMS